VKSKKGVVSTKDFERYIDDDTIGMRVSPHNTIEELDSLLSVLRAI